MGKRRELESERVESKDQVSDEENENEGGEFRLAGQDEIAKRKYIVCYFVVS